MRPRLFSFFVPAVLALLIASTCTRALADNAPQPSNASPATPCGATIKEKLAAARQALRTNPDHNAALVCLIEATEAISAEQSNYEAGRVDHWHPPFNKDPVNPDGPAH